jgi:hypothetical protein
MQKALSSQADAQKGGAASLPVECKVLTCLLRTRSLASAQCVAFRMVLAALEAYTWRGCHDGS